MSINIHTIKDIRNYLGNELKGIYPESEISSFARIIIKTRFNIKRLHQLYDTDQTVTSESVKEIVEICNELKSGKPIQYIVGETSFYNCRIKVNNETLIPRPETEELVDCILKDNRGYNGNITDIGTGSGCIAIVLAKKFPDAEITGIDVSANALKLAAENALLNNVHVSFVKADILRINPKRVFPAGLVVSNPPYVRESEKQKMNKNVLDFEPHSALFVPDSDPLIFYRTILRSSKNLLLMGGKIYFEINEALGKEMTELLMSYGFSGISIIKDINGKNRIVKGTWNG